MFKALARASIGEQLAAVQAMVETFPGSSAELLRFVLTTMGNFVRTSDRVILPKMLLAEIFPSWRSSGARRSSNAVSPCSAASSRAAWRAVNSAPSRPNMPPGCVLRPFC